jgi:hypothetical protein
VIGEAYVGKSGREMITAPVHEITKGMNAAGLSQKDEEDANYLNICTI